MSEQIQVETDENDKEMNQVESATEEKPTETGYLARDEYTSERFKLELNNLPKYFGFAVSIESFVVEIFR